jgi:undecaprenyl phosphate-alpha-L-ara4N flippase subunit ArnE
MALAVLLLALSSTAFAQLFYKLYVSKRRRLSLLALALSLFALAQIGFFVALTLLDLGVVYMSTGLIQVIVLLLSRFVLKENISRDHWIAVGLIWGGLVLYFL